MERSSSMSADVYNNPTIGLGMKNYPKLTPHMPTLVHWFQSSGEVFFHVSWCVQQPQFSIGLEKLPQIDPPYAYICPLVPKLWRGLLPCELIYTATLSMDWASKTTPNWPPICLNLSSRSKVMYKSFSTSADSFGLHPYQLFCTWHSCITDIQLLPEQ